MLQVLPINLLFFRLFPVTLNTSWTWILVRRNTCRYSSTTSSRRASRVWATPKLKTFWTSPWSCSDTCKRRIPLKSITSDTSLDDCSTRNRLPTIRRRWWSANSSRSAAVSSHPSWRACSRTWRCPTPSTRSSRLTCWTRQSHSANWQTWVFEFSRPATGQDKILRRSSTCQEFQPLLSTFSRTSTW